MKKLPAFLMTVLLPMVSLTTTHAFADANQMDETKSSDNSSTKKGQNNNDDEDPDC